MASAPIAQPKTREDKLNEKMQELINRYATYSGWYLINEKIGLGLPVMLNELYVQLAIVHSNVLALTSILSRNRRVKPLDLQEFVTNSLESRLADLERQYKIRILVGECYSVDEQGNKVEDPPEENKSTEGTVQ